MIQITSDQPVDMFTISLEDAAWLPFVVTPVTSTAAVLSVSHNLDYEQDPYLDIVVKAVSSITKAVAFKTFEITVSLLLSDISCLSNGRTYQLNVVI